MLKQFDFVSQERTFTWVGDVGVFEPPPHLLDGLGCREHLHRWHVASIRPRTVVFAPLDSTAGHPSRSGGGAVRPFDLDVRVEASSAM